MGLAKPCHTDGNAAYMASVKISKNVLQQVQP